MALSVNLSVIMNSRWPKGEEEYHQNDGKGDAHNPEDPVEINTLGSGSLGENGVLM